MTLTCTHEQLSDAARGLCFLHEGGMAYRGSLKPVRGAPFSLIVLNSVNRVAY